MAPVKLRVVMLCGKKGSGKSTIAKYLVRTRGFVHYSLAGPLKDACSVCLIS